MAIHLMGSKYNIDFVKYFGHEIQSLRELVADGMLEITRGKITVTSLGNIFIPHICKIFDYYLKGNKAYKITGP